MRSSKRNLDADPVLSNEKEKANWDTNATQCFIHACLEQVAKGERLGTSFTKAGWEDIDGTHVPCVVTPSEQLRYIGRKGISTQNILAVCNWNMCFIFVLPRWEGTAHDTRVFEHALTNANMNFLHLPPGKYYLVDAGYPTPMGYLGPYRRERYHLPDFRCRFGLANHNETFNFYHSSLRCTIERTFGVWKNRFAILGCMPKQKFETQVQIVCATITIHNFIKRNAETDADFNRFEDENIDIDMDNHDFHSERMFNQSQVINVVSSTQMNRVRDSIRDQTIDYKKNN